MQRFVSLLPFSCSRTRICFRVRVAFLLLTLSFMAARAPAESPQTSETTRIPLARNWQLQSSCVAKADGREISTAGPRAEGWHKTTVPTTVVAALVADGTYPDPYFGMNLKSFPGMDYSSKSFFANQSMPAGSPFRCSVVPDRV